MMFKTLSKLQRLFDYSQAAVQFDLAPYQAQLNEINAFRFEAESTAALQRYAHELKEQVRDGIPIDHLLTRAFALIRELSRRLLGMRPFDVQVLAGLALHEGKVVEMLTGEGKTLAAVLPACLNALAGQGVHILTFNDYLAKRDALWMGPVYRFFGLEVNYLQHSVDHGARKRAYAGDVVYLTAREAGFDYLRDFLRDDPVALTQRPFFYAIVDEADSILIDEGRIPLVIAGQRDAALDQTRLSLAGLVRTLRPDLDYETDESGRTVFLTEAGSALAEKTLNCGNLYLPHNLTLLTLLNHALHAAALLRRDIDYIIRNGRVELVDEFTGRVIANRHWPDGLQEAVEAKEGLARRPGGKIWGTVTMQHFLSCYPRIAGMTGTARAAATELKEFYDLDVVAIPPHRPCIRADEPDWIFTHPEAKQRALLAEIARAHSTGRPVLIGTASVAESEQLAGMLRQKRIRHQLLNAKNDALEAEIIARAGALGAVTIATNMAGRGTDIRLGGPDERQREQVVALGGLYVIGTNRFESPRIDDQLRGRAGRQGDPGASRFLISLEDELFVKYGIGEFLPQQYREIKQDEPLADPKLERQVRDAQKIIAAQNYEIRRNLWQYAWLVEKQRRRFQQRRQDILLDREPLSLFRTALPERYRTLLMEVGEAVLARAEKQVTLYCLDNLWADFLEDVAALREGIHLVQLSGKVPLDEFQKGVWEAYQDLRDRIDRETTARLETAVITVAGLDLEREGLRGPSATWTYFMDDTPFGNKLEMLLAPFFKGLLKKVVKRGAARNGTGGRRL